MKTFKKGDSIVLVDNDDLDVVDLVLYTTYIVDFYIDEGYGSGYSPSLLTLVGIDAALAPERFVTLQQFRRNKLNKLFNRISK